MGEARFQMQDLLSSAMSRESRADRRRFVRSELDIRVRFQPERVQQHCHCRSVDISEGGIGLVAPYEFEVGQKGQLEFSLPDAAAPIQVQAVVRSRAGFRYGLEFLNLGDSQRREIVRFGLRPVRSI